MLPLGSANCVLHARSRRHSVRDLPGPLSIKSVVSGSVTWHTEGRFYRLTPSSALVLADGQPYSLHIDEARPVETHCVFFEHGFVEDVHRTMRLPEHILLDDPHPRPAPLAFAPRLIAPPDAFPLNRDFMWLAEQLVRSLSDGPSCPVRRPSTQAELLRRISRAQQYLHAHFDAPVSLAELAREACLSPYHLHRSFRSVFRRTPLAYQTELRLLHARALLLDGRSAAEACLDSGYESLPSFTQLFKRRFGCTPSQIRKIR
ncbi:MAG: AraC family transcriptional regulator [Bryobacteraceae bacterium]|nr:AraC family transcriptional regulator [Bryobacteraceae bacterium]